MVTIKTAQEISYIRKACETLKLIHQELKAMIKPGVTGLMLNQKAEEIMAANDCVPNFKGLYNFPASICVSLNDVLVHGIPDHRPFQNGDLVSVDAGCAYQGYNSDGAFTVIVGNPKDPIDEKLVFVTKTSLEKAIAILKPGVRIGDISATIQSYVEENGFFLPTEFTGHGIGRNLHEEPHIPNSGPVGVGMRLQAGMTICIEPMVQIGTKEIKMLSDNWTPVSKNRLNSAHFEHTILITDQGCEVLT
ncbi:type I methionyl aminopeptidase [Spiroplasma chrysopicola]|uniref:Methionine aminopeptidase n=1 Tax=Spiroplasma chrysopicola DF-1 TaxID=1276227 RepID=R4U0L9_9MOLU|nr:type I methionyl aminopeptidase [Spiroplasma chrysopicola]AGM24807.1 methionine aminopeptidase [Spiroplasma chrysopicola DF-1]